MADRRFQQPAIALALPPPHLALQRLDAEHRDGQGVEIGEDAMVGGIGILCGEHQSAFARRHEVNADFASRGLIIGRGVVAGEAFIVHPQSEHVVFGYHAGLTMEGHVVCLLIKPQTASQSQFMGRQQRG